VGAGSYESTRANIWKLDNPSSEEAQPGHQTIDSPGVAKNDRDRAPMFADEWDDRDKRRFDEGRWLSEDDEVRRGTERGRSDGAATESLIQTASGEEGRRTEVAREAAHEVYGQCTECRSPGGIGGLCPRCRDARAADAPTQEATILEYQRSYASNFDKTPQLNDLWTRACKDADDDFRSARRNFWTLVNTDSSPEAQFVRQMIQAAGFTVDDRECAPMLADEWDDRKKGRYNNARRLSIDHEVPQSKKPDLSMVASNLRFMLMDDNLRRGAHYGAGEKPYD